MTEQMEATEEQMHANAHRDALRRLLAKARRKHAEQVERVLLLEQEAAAVPPTEGLVGSLGRAFYGGSHTETATDRLPVERVRRDLRWHAVQFLEEALGSIEVNDA